MLLDLKLIKVNTFINELSWYELTCFEKVQLILLESLKQNSLYYYLLFQNLPRDDFYSLLAQKTGYAYSSKIEYTFDISSTLRELLEQKRTVMLTIDEFYSTESAMYYLKEHHSHFIVLKGYDKSTGRFLVVDEDKDLRKMKISTGVPYGYIYKLKWISCDTIIQLCNSRELLKLNANNQYIQALAFHEFEKKQEVTINFDILINEYIKNVQKSIEQHDSLYIEVVDSLELLKSNTGANCWYESNSLLFRHHKDIMCQLLLLLNLTDIFKDIGSEISHFYFIIRSLIKKYDLSRDDKIIKKIMVNISSSFELEKQFYIKVLHLLKDKKIEFHSLG